MLHFRKTSADRSLSDGTQNYTTVTGTLEAGMGRIQLLVSTLHTLIRSSSRTTMSRQDQCCHYQQTDNLQSRRRLLFPLAMWFGIGTGKSTR